MVASGRARAVAQLVLWMAMLGAGTSRANARGGTGCGGRVPALKLRGGEADFARDTDSSPMSALSGDGSRASYTLDDESLHASQLALSSSSVRGAGEEAPRPNDDPGELAQRYWSLPARSRQLLDDLVRAKWRVVTNESIRELGPWANTELPEAHSDDAEPLTGMKLEEVWEGDQQLCVRVVAAEKHSGVLPGDVLKNIEGIDCSQKSLAEVGRLIADFNENKPSVQIGMLRGAQRGSGEGGGEGQTMYSLILERGWLASAANQEGRGGQEDGEHEAEREAEAVHVLKRWGLWPLTSL